MISACGGPRVNIASDQLVSPHWLTWSQPIRNQWGDVNGRPWNSWRRLWLWHTLSRVPAYSVYLCVFTTCLCTSRAGLRSVLIFVWNQRSSSLSLTVRKVAENGKWCFISGLRMYAAKYLCDWASSNFCSRIPECYCCYPLCSTLSQLLLGNLFLLQQLVYTFPGGQPSV